ncbi:unnamed protein product [Choristocarpus tenellus]
MAGKGTLNAANPRGCNILPMLVLRSCKLLIAFFQEEKVRSMAFRIMVGLPYEIIGATFCRGNCQLEKVNAPNHHHCHHGYLLSRFQHSDHRAAMMYPCQTLANGIVGQRKVLRWIFVRLGN